MHAITAAEGLFILSNLRLSNSCCIFSPQLRTAAAALASKRFAAMNPEIGDSLR
jgi:hypothetical protein